MVGREISQLFPKNKVSLKETLSRRTFSWLFSDISFSLGPGKLLDLAGWLVPGRTGSAIDFWHSPG